MEENKKNKIPNVPNLRFNYSEEWRHLKLINFYKVQMCKRIFANQTSVIGDIPFYKIGTLGTNADSFISNSLFYEYKEKFNYPQKGETLLTCSGTVGKCVQFDGKPSYYQDSNIVWLRGLLSPISNDFLFRLLKQNDWSKLNTTTISRIYSNDLLSLSFSYPPSFEEQAYICSFLDCLDKRIEAQNKIIDKCKSLIKCICDSAEMNSNKQLKEIADYNSSIIKESAVSSKGKYPVFGAAGICGYLDDYVFSKAGIAIVKDGAGVGRLLKIKNHKYSILGTMGLIEPKNGISQDYLWLALKKITFKKYIVGSGIPHIYFSDYSSAQIPSFTDRNFIRAKLCDLLLEKIKIDEVILTKILKQKEFLLNNLFI